MNTYTSKYPKSYWDNDIIEYLGLKKGNPYYKSYMSTCLLNKLKDNGMFSYGRYELDNNLIKIFSTKLNSNYIWKYTSKSGINNMLSYFRHSDTNYKNESFYVIDFNEDGNNVEVLSI